MASTKGKDVVVEACEIPPAATHAIAPVAFEGYHILEAEAVMVTHSFPSPNIVPSANIMTDPVLAIPTSKVSGCIGSLCTRYARPTSVFIASLG